MRVNPIADAFDTAIPALQADEKRTLSGFLSFACGSVEYERFQRNMLSIMIDEAIPLSEKVYRITACSMWMGFESGKSYVIGGHVDNMLRMEDEWDRQHGSV